MHQRSGFNLFVFVATSTGLALAKLPFTDEPCGKQYMEHRCLRLVCKRRHVIYDLDVIGQHGTNCTGKTGRMLADTARCFWHPECSVQFPRERMLMGLFTDGMTTDRCVYKRPDALKVTAMKCAREKVSESSISLLDIYDMCSKKRLQKKGIIRSHKHYPWANLRNETEDINCTLEYKSKKPTGLHITVLRLDIVTCDTLTINGESIVEGLTYKYDSPVTIEFNKCSQSQAPGSGLGFLLCFKEIETGKGNMTNVCEQISEKSGKRLKIIEVGPTTKTCVKSRKKKKKKKWCCCDDSTCTEHMKLAKEFKKQVASTYDWEKCESQRFPCECKVLN